ncbi:MAG: peptide chain release factor N(5)-glutamine methyltransferase [Candidatus Acidoferrales bacterium]|nr:peptide chain release factor N(5)-glutamine methyltransferase [Candidatus Acidoferrales bacterium]
MTVVTTDRSVRSLLKQGIGRLREANVPSFTLVAELLLLYVAARDRTWLYAHPEEILSADTTSQYFALIQRRANGEPTQHLTGKQEFWDLEFEITSDVLIPRPETEHLIEVALDRLALRELRAGRPPRLTGNGLTLVDVGTGSGCIAIALAKELPDANVYATDISATALDVARRNAARRGFADRIRFLESDLFEAFTPVRFDLIVSNPPYVGRRTAETLAREVREHEPEVALYGGEEGYEFYAELVAQSHEFLKPGGLLVLELGHDSLPAVQPLLESRHWTNLGVTNDLAGIPRVLAVERT